jgi:pimeloyl-ACP methyl ester carboxylesterase
VRVTVNGVRLWFDVEGASLVPDGDRMRARPTVLLLHGGPGGYDSSYFKPWFGRLAQDAQVVYLDLRDHGRSERTNPASWSFEVCADDVAAFCEALDLERPVVLGHSMGGFVALLLAARWPEQPGGLVLQSTMARFDLARLVAGFRQVAGDEVAELAHRDWSGDDIGDEEWASVFAAFGPHVPDADSLARRRRNPELGPYGMARMREFDAVAELRRIRCPTLVCVGALDPGTPVAAAREIADGLAPGIGRLEVLPGAGHFPWLDAPERYEDVLRSFVAAVV